MTPGQFIKYWCLVSWQPTWVQCQTVTRIPAGLLLLGTNFFEIWTNFYEILIANLFSTWCNWECHLQNDGHFCLGLSLLCDIIIQSIPRDKRMEFQWFNIFTHVHKKKIVEHDPCSCYRVDCRMNGVTYLLFSLWTRWQMLVTVWLMPAWPWQISLHSIQTDGLLHCLTHVKGQTRICMENSTGGRRTVVGWHIE